MKFNIITLITEDLLLEKDNRPIIKSKILPSYGLDPEEWSWLVDEAYKISDKYSVWIVNSFLKHINKVKKETSAAKDNFFSSGHGYYDSPKKNYQYIIDWLTNRNRTGENYKLDFDNLSYDLAMEKAVAWHGSLKAEGVILDEEGETIITYPDGFYWIDLKGSSSKAEADAMGHCGNCPRQDHLFSLRKNKHPFVSLCISDEKEITQCKGKQNTKPKEEYHSYIVDFIIKQKVTGLNSGYDPASDFQFEDLNDELLMKVLKENPDAMNDIITGITLFEKGILIAEQMNEKFYKPETEIGKVPGMFQKNEVLCISKDWGAFAPMFAENRDGSHAEFFSKMIDGDLYDNFWSESEISVADAIGMFDKENEQFFENEFKNQAQYDDIEDWLKSTEYVNIFQQAHRDADMQAMERGYWKQYISSLKDIFYRGPEQEDGYIQASITYEQLKEAIKFYQSDNSYTLKKLTYQLVLELWQTLLKDKQELADPGDASWNDYDDKDFNERVRDTRDEV